VPNYLTINLISGRCNIRCKTPRIKNRIRSRLYLLASIPVQ